MLAKYTSRVRPDLNTSHHDSYKVERLPINLRIRTNRVGPARLSTLEYFFRSNNDYIDQDIKVPIRAHNERGPRFFFNYTCSPEQCPLPILTRNLFVLR